MNLEEVIETLLPPAALLLLFPLAALGLALTEFFKKNSCIIRKSDSLHFGALFTMEAVQLANMDPEKIINTHMEFVAPAIQRMTHTNLLDNGRNRGQGQ